MYHVKSYSYSTMGEQLNGIQHADNVTNFCQFKLIQHPNSTLSGFNDLYIISLKLNLMLPFQLKSERVDMAGEIMIPL